MNFIIIIIIISLIEFIEDSNFKLYSWNNTYKNLITGSIAYIIIVLLLIFILKYTNILYINGMWDGVSAIIESILAILILKEKLYNPIQYISLILIISGIFVLNIGSIPN